MASMAGDVFEMDVGGFDVMMVFFFKQKTAYEVEPKSEKDWVTPVLFFAL